ncbi:hypothetical protein H1V43_06245 [Streptomyces sp. PSKA54]|uniref:Uncharacterized protein n=1 Tax=Streptomyces himalayensis subsp. aureolus TaxID=2758039 RepID=A0A7W2CXN9_9ACTN|nr:hypothetical protein [Streptomyces himalayensis subsp. aureolus]
MAIKAGASGNSGKAAEAGKSAQADKAALEGGPDDLREQIVPLTAPEPASQQDLKIPHRGGYEHYRATQRQKKTPEGKVPVYEWWERTEIAE